MQKTLKSDQNPITQILNKDFPEHKEWFTDLRDRRNRIKAFGDFDTLIEEDDILIRFILIDEGDETMNQKNSELNVSPIHFGDYFEKSIANCMRLNECIFNIFKERFSKET